MTMRVTLLMIVVLSPGCAIRQVDTARSMEPGQIGGRLIGHGAGGWGLTT